MKTFDEVVEVCKQIRALAEQVDDNWDELDDEAQECWENFRENMKALL
jgi:hypothetical protein